MFVSNKSRISFDASDEKCSAFRHKTNETLCHIHKERLSMKMSRQFPLNAMRVFDTVARLRSFTKAGEELGMTQTAVSYQVKLLEENIGEPLFIRSARKVSLTETGEKLAPKVAEAFGILREAVSNARDSLEGTLTIDTTPTFAARWLSYNVGAFQLENPRIAVRLETSMSLVDFAQSDVDLAIRAGHGKWPGLTGELLMRGGFTPMLSPALAASIGGISKPADLLKLRIIDRGDPWWSQWFEEAGIPNPQLDHQPTSRFGSQTIEAAAAIAGQGVAMLTPKLYEDEVALGRLIQPFDIVSNDGADYWLVYPDNRKNSRKLRLFRDWIFKLMPEGARKPDGQNPISGA
jgi:LysR family glycine cleavage system transcriptional activator